MAKRTGIPSIIKYTRLLCRAIVFFAPNIREATNNNAAVIAALEAALAACSALEVVLSDFVEQGD